MTAFLIIFLFIVDAGIFLYFKSEIRKVKLLSSDKAEETDRKIPIEEQWNNFLSFDGGRQNKD